MKQPWERRQNESAKAHAAFVKYCELGSERSCAAVAKELGKSRQLIERWCSRHEWVERVTEYDVWMHQQSLRAQVREVAEMGKRHARQCVNTLRLVDLNLQALTRKYAPLLARIEAGEEVVLEPFMSVPEMSRVLEATAKLERLCRGVPDGISELKLKDAEGENGDLPVDLACKVARAYLERHGGEVSADTQGKGPVSQAEVANLVNNITAGRP